MALRRYVSEPDIVSFNHRCVRCRQGLDRDGRYCRRCLRTQRLKIAFGSVAAVQLAALAYVIMQSAEAAHVVRAAGTQAIVASGKGQSGWLYYDITDPLLADVTHHARLIADNPLPPKGAPAVPGAVGGALEVAYSRHYGSTVMVSFPPVRKACGANPCELRAIFDQQPARAMRFDDVSDDRKTVLMLGDGERFIASLAAAHDLTIVASLGAGPDTIISFDVAGFKMTLAALRTRMRLAFRAGHPGST
jgi:hypothetical protein